MNIAVATNNPVKIRAVKKALADAYPHETITIQKLSINLELPEQPMNEAIAAGALARARAAQSHAGADFGVGIEAGLMLIPGMPRWVSVQVCAVADNAGRDSIGMVPGYELPQSILDAVLEGESLRDAFERVLSQADPDRHGAVFYLSKGSIDRFDLTVQGIRMAIIPWLSEKYS